MFELKDPDVIDDLLKNHSTWLIATQRSSYSALRQLENVQFKSKGVLMTCQVITVKLYRSYSDIPDNLKPYYLDNPENIDYYGAFCAHLVLI